MSGTKAGKPGNGVKEQAADNNRRKQSADARYRISKEQDTSRQPKCKRSGKVDGLRMKVPKL